MVFECNDTHTSEELTLKNREILQIGCRLRIILHKLLYKNNKQAEDFFILIQFSRV